MITITTKSARVMEFIRACRVSHQRLPSGLIQHTYVLRVNSLEDVIRWHAASSVFRSHLVVIYRGLNTYELVDAQDIIDAEFDAIRQLQQIRYDHEILPPPPSEVPPQEPV